MNHTKKQSANSAATSIDITRAEQASYWAHKLGCTHAQLYAAVAAVGNDAAAVTNHLLRAAGGAPALAA